jgi:hypothetical protein
MFQLSSLTKRITATMLMVVFLHMLVSQCLCAALGVALNAGKAVAAKPAPRTLHACCQKFSKLKKQLANKPAPARSNHDCCKNRSVAILKAMSTPPAKLLLEAPAVLDVPPTYDFTPARFVAWDMAAAVVLVPRQHLPPKIPDIRVFLRSLTV